MSKRLFVWISLLLVAILVLASCGSDQTNTGTTTPSGTTSSQSSTTPISTKTTEVTSTPDERYGGTLKILTRYHPASDPGWPADVATMANAVYYITFMYAEPLVYLSRTQEIECWLAESYTVDYSATSPSVTFNLRQGVKFHDGTDFNAEAVKFHLEKVMESKYSNTLKWKSVDVIDNYTVRLNLTEYTNTFWCDISHTSCFIVSPTPYKEKGLDYVREHPCGTGPFIMTDFKKDESGTFERNPNYWQPGKPYLDKIIFEVVPDLVTQQMSMQSGNAHVMLLQDGKEMREMAQLGFNVIRYPAGCVTIMPDTTNPNSVFANLKVREAVDCALDRQAGAATLGYGYDQPSSQLAPIGDSSYVSSIPDVNYDPDKARQLLADAGYPNGIDTTIYTWYIDINYALMIQEQLEKVGIRAQVENLETVLFFDKWQNGWSDGLLVVSQGFNPNFAYSIKLLFPPDGSMNKSMYMSEEMLDLLDRCVKATDFQEQVKLNQELVKMIYDEKLAITFLSTGKGFVLSPKVQGTDFLWGAERLNSWRPADTYLSK